MPSIRLSEPFDLLLPVFGWFSGLVLVGALIVFIWPPPESPAAAKGDRNHVLPRDIGPRAVQIQRLVPPMPLPLPTPAAPMVPPEPVTPLPLEGRLDAWWPTPPAAELPTPPSPTVEETEADAEVWPILEKPAPVSSKPKDRGDQLCARHGMKKVWISDKRWRCRK